MRRVGPAVLAVLVAATGLVGCSDDDAAPQARSEPRPSAETTRPAPTDGVDGGDGVGDPYFPQAGNSGYQVERYDLVMDVRIAGPDRLDATATITMVPTEDLRSFHLDLLGFEVSKVTVDDADATVARDGRELIVTPARQLVEGDTTTVVVAYSGSPGRTGSSSPAGGLIGDGGWVDLGDDWSTVIAEPVGAATWFPSNDHPSDKAIVNVTATVPAGLEAVAGGRLVERTDAADRSTFRWEAAEPMSPYLASLTVGDMQLSEKDGPAGIRILDGVPARRPELLDGALSRFPEMITFFGQRFGPYPFRDAGNVIVPGLEPVALETQTRSVHSESILEPALGTLPDEVTAHELTHQWFGDAVGPADWSMIWLNEGFATYGEWLWLEHIGGRTVMESARAAHDGDPDLNVPPASPGVGQLFGRTVYQRGGMFLVELGRLLGQPTFDQLLTTWVDQHRFGVATTEQFVALAVEMAGPAKGAQVTALADAWLHAERIPELTP